MAKGKLVFALLSFIGAASLLLLVPSETLRSYYYYPSGETVIKSLVNSTTGTSNENNTNAYDAQSNWFGNRIFNRDEHGIAGEHDDDDVDASSEFRSSDGIFPGAREWYNYWTYNNSSTVGKGEDGEAAAAYLSNIYDDYVEKAVRSRTEATLQHIDNMQRRYMNVNALPDFRTRGIGWIHTRLDMALTLVIAGDFVIDGAAAATATATTEVDQNTTLHLRAGPATIFIVDTIGKLKCGGGGDGDRDDAWIDMQPPLTMWVRINGMSPDGIGNGGVEESEIFAGTAIPHKLKTSTSSSKSSSSSRCTWRYDFSPRNAGVYSVHVKVLNFNGFIDYKSGHECTMQDIPIRNNSLFDNQKLNKTNGDTIEILENMNYEFVKQLAIDMNYSHHRGVSGFKFYDPKNGCCEACKRSRGCIMFSIPGAHHFDECELYFDKLEDDIDFVDAATGIYLGRERNYSYVKQLPSDFVTTRKLQQQQQRRRRRRRMAISAKELKKPGTLWPVGIHPVQGYPPIQSSGGGTTYFLGCGWSSTMTFESPCHDPSDDLVYGSGQKINVLPDASIIVDDGLRACLPDDEKLGVSNGRWVRRLYPDDSACPLSKVDRRNSKFSVFRLEYVGNADPKCWHRDDITQIANTCAEPGCQFVVNHRWVTDLKRDNKWYGWWKQYSCEYREMGDSDIQNCVDQKKVSSIEVRGASLKTVIEAYLSQKLQNINMTTETSNVVVIDTLKLPHVLWHNGIEEHRKILESYANVTADSGPTEYYFLSGFYLTSEREPHVQVDRSLQFSQAAYDILTAKGYKMINAFDVTAAFAFDTDGQADGLHIGGPPIRSIVTKFFHHLCHDIKDENSNKIIESNATKSKTNSSKV